MDEDKIVDMSIEDFKQFYEEYVFAIIKKCPEYKKFFLTDYYMTTREEEMIDTIQHCDNLVYSLFPIESENIVNFLKIGGKFNWQLRCNFLLYHGYSPKSLNVQECVMNGAVVKTIYCSLKNSVEEIAGYFEREYLRKYFLELRKKKIVMSDINIVQYLMDYLKKKKITCRYITFEILKRVILTINKLLRKGFIYFSYARDSYRILVEDRGSISLNEYNFTIQSVDYYEEFTIVNGKYTFRKDGSLLYGCIFSIAAEAA